MNVLKTAGDIVKVAGEYLTKNSPTILTAIGLGCMVAAVVVAVKQPVAVEEELYELEKKEENQAKVENRELKHPMMPRVKIYVRHYWSTAALLVLAGGSILLANHLRLKAESALLALLASKSTYAKDLEDKIADLDGKRKLEKITDEIAKDKIKANPPPTYPGSQTKDFWWIYDIPAERYMWGNMMMVRAAFSEIGLRLCNGEMYVDQNDLFDEFANAGLVVDGRIGVPHSGDGSKLGFSDASDFQMPRETTDKMDNGCPVSAINYELKPLPYSTR